MLTEGNACWDELRTSFTELSDWLKEQMEMAESTDVGAVEDIKEMAIEMAKVEEFAEDVKAVENNQEYTGITYLIN